MTRRRDSRQCARPGGSVRAEFRRWRFLCCLTPGFRVPLVHFTPEQETQLSQIATHAGTDAERLVKDAALRLLQEDARFRAALREGIAQTDRGEFIEEEEMDARRRRGRDYSRVETMARAWPPRA